MNERSQIRQLEIVIPQGSTLGPCLIWYMSMIYQTLYILVQDCLQMTSACFSQQQFE